MRLALIIVGSLVALALLGWLLVGLSAAPSFETSEFLGKAARYDVLIIFNSGGWGNTRIEKAVDYASVLDGIEGTVGALGYSYTIVEFVRTPGGPSSMLFDIKELLNDFEYSSQVEAEQIRAILKSFPGKKVIITGLSLGGAVSERTLERIGNLPNVSAVVAGAPGWYRRVAQANVLSLDNNGRDALAQGNTGKVILAVAKSPFIWVYSRIMRKPISLALAIQIEGHEYDWSSPAVGPPIREFLDSLLGQRAR